MGWAVQTFVLGYPSTHLIRKRAKAMGVSVTAAAITPIGRVAGTQWKIHHWKHLDFQKAPLQFCLDMAEEYGDICKFKVGLDTWHLVNNAAFIDVTVKKANIFHKPRFVKRLWKPFLGDGVLSLDGDAANAFRG